MVKVELTPLPHLPRPFTGPQDYMWRNLSNERVPNLDECFKLPARVRVVAGTGPSQLGYYAANSHVKQLVSYDMGPGPLIGIALARLYDDLDELGVIDSLYDGTLGMELSPSDFAENSNNIDRLSKILADYFAEDMTEVVQMNQWMKDSDSMRHWTWGIVKGLRTTGPYFPESFACINDSVQRARILGGVKDGQIIFRPLDLSSPAAIRLMRLDIGTCDDSRGRWALYFSNTLDYLFKNGLLEVKDWENIITWLRSGKVERIISTHIESSYEEVLNCGRLSAGLLAELEVEKSDAGGFVRERYSLKNL